MFGSNMTVYFSIQNDVDLILQNSKYYCGVIYSQCCVHSLKGYWI